MNQYDVIVVGCNSSSLISALSLMVDGYKVLLIDKHSTIGDLTKNNRLGRFKIEDTLHNLYINYSNYNYSLSKILDRCGIKNTTSYVEIDNLCSIKVEDKLYTLPIGIDKFINYLDSKIKGSKDNLIKLFELGKIVRDTMDYIVTHINNINYKYIKKDFNNVCNFTVEEGFKYVGINGTLKKVLDRLCIYYGSESSSLSFVEYLSFLVNVIDKGVCISKDSDDSLFNLLLYEYNKKNGLVRLNTNVVSLIIEDGSINGVRLSTGEVLYAQRVVVSNDIKNVYENMIQASDVPRIALKHLNQREEGTKVFSVHLGLNRSFEELKLSEYMYLLTDNMIVVVHNNAYKYISEDGTSLISIHYLLRDNKFINAIDKKNYYFEIDKMTKKIIEEFQDSLDIEIYDYIEEIKVVTPFDNNKVFEYKKNINESLLAKILNSNNERYIKGLYVCEGLNGDVYGYGSSFISGLGPSNYFKNEGDFNEKN